MAQITLSFVLMLISLIIKAANQIVRLLGTIIDLTDDGVINGSKRPDWYSKLVDILATASALSASLEDFENDAVNTPIKD